MRLIGIVRELACHQVALGMANYKLEIVDERCGRIHVS